MNAPLITAAALSFALLGGCAATRDAFDSTVDTSQEVASDIADAEVWNQIGEGWDNFRTSAANRWDRLTEEDLNDIDGDREELIEDVADYYDISEEEAAEQVDTWAVTQS